MKKWCFFLICSYGSFSAGGNTLGNGNIKNGHDQVNGGSVPTVVWFYSLKSQSYIKELKFRSVVYLVRCSSRIVAVLQSAQVCFSLIHYHPSLFLIKIQERTLKSYLHASQVHCFDVATLQREYTFLTNPIATTPSRFEKIGLGHVVVGLK